MITPSFYLGEITYQTTRSSTVSLASYGVLPQRLLRMRRGYSQTRLSCADSPYSNGDDMHSAVHLPQVLRQLDLSLTALPCEDICHFCCTGIQEDRAGRR